MTDATDTPGTTPSPAVPELTPAEHRAAIAKIVAGRGKGPHSYPIFGDGTRVEDFRLIDKPEGN